MKPRRFNHSRERGFISFRALFGLAIVAAVIYLCVKLLPPYVNNYQLQDGITNIARYAAYAQQKSAEDVKKDVLEKARDCDVLLLPEQVEIEKTGTTVNISVKYTIRVELPGKVLEMNFNPTAGNKIITAR